MKIKNVLISVYDKSKLENFARFLIQKNINIYSTGGTYKFLKEKNIKVRLLSEYTNVPELLDGRVKTLVWQIYAGILAIRDKDTHLKQLQENKIIPFDMIVVNLYPFEKVLKQKPLEKELIEFIDIGGVTLLRAAAKNFYYTVPVPSPEFYEKIMNELKQKENISEELRRMLASYTFWLTSKYDAIIATGLFEKKKEFPEKGFVYFEKEFIPRYGENSHQKSVFYSIHSLSPYFKEASLSFTQYQGKELSYNNIFDFIAGAQLAGELKINFPEKKNCVIIKHRIPCGASLDIDEIKAYKKALASDPVSAFGGIVVISSEVNEQLARLIVKRFYEIIVAEKFTREALKIFKQKKNLRVIKIKNLKSLLKSGYVFIKLYDKLIVQERDIELFKTIEPVTKKKPGKKEIEELKFAYLICKYVKSNAIVYTKNFQVIGIGAGQPSRVDSAKIGIWKAKEMGFSLKNSYMASDAFFPFPDSIEIAGKEGVKAIIQPGGSIRDKEVIKKADELGLKMVLTKMRHFLH